MAIIYPTKYYCTVSYSQKYYYIIAIYNSNTYSAGMKERCRDGCRTSLLIAGVVLVPAIFHTLLPPCHPYITIHFMEMIFSTCIYSVGAEHRYTCMHLSSTFSLIYIHVPWDTQTPLKHEGRSIWRERMIYKDIDCLCLTWCWFSSTYELSMACSGQRNRWKANNNNALP